MVTMAYIPRSSLIPTEASGAIPVQMKRKRTIHAFGLIATIIFILSLLGAVGVFLYQNYLTDQLQVAKEGLSAMDDAEASKKIAEVRRYDEKLRAAQQLLKNHISPVLVFEEIEESTKVTVQFTSLEFVYDPGFEASLTLSGNTREFSSVALQKMQILEDEVFSEFVLQDIANSEGSERPDGSVTPSGVTFSVTGVFKPEHIAYDGTLVTDTDASPVTATTPSLPVTSGAEASVSSTETDNGGTTDADSIVPVVAPPTL